MLYTAIYKLISDEMAHLNTKQFIKFAAALVGTLSKDVDNGQLKPDLTACKSGPLRFNGSLMATGQRRDENGAARDSRQSSVSFCL